MSEIRQRKKASGTSETPSQQTTRLRNHAGRNVNICSILLPLILFWVAMALAISYIATGTITFGKEVPSYQKILSKVMPPKRVFTLDELSRYDGTDLTKPVYLGILGRVYDVSKGRRFYAKPDGSYSMFSGTDAGRAFVTGCFKTHITHDVRGLTDEQITSIKNWQNFYENSNEYFFVGTIDYPPIDQDSPIPEDCTNKPTA